MRTDSRTLNAMAWAPQKRQRSDVADFPVPRAPTGSAECYSVAGETVQSCSISNSGTTCTLYTGTVSIRATMQRMFVSPSCDPFLGCRTRCVFVALDHAMIACSKIACSKMSILSYSAVSITHGFSFSVLACLHDDALTRVYMRCQNLIHASVEPTDTCRRHSNDTAAPRTPTGVDAPGHNASVCESVTQRHQNNWQLF